MAPVFIFRKNLKVLAIFAGVSLPIGKTPLAQFLNIAFSCYGASLHESYRLHPTSAAD